MRVRSDDEVDFRKMSGDFSVFVDSHMTDKNKKIDVMIFFEIANPGVGRHVEGSSSEFFSGTAFRVRQADNTDVDSSQWKEDIRLVQIPECSSSLHV